MESDAESVTFQDSLCQMSEQLTTTDMKQMKFLCLDYIPIGILEKMDSIDLIQILLERRLIQHNKIDFLLECLILMGRIDTAFHLHPDRYYIDRLSNNLHQYNSTGGLSSFKIMLFYLADNITEIEVKKLILYLNRTPGISHGKIKMCVTAFDLFTYLINVRYVHPSDLKKLTNLIIQLKRMDLSEKIDTFSEMNKEDKTSAKEKVIEQESTPEQVEQESTPRNDSPDWHELVKSIPSEKQYSLCERLGISSSNYKMFKNNLGGLLETKFSRNAFTLEDLEKAMKGLHLKEKKDLGQLEKYVMTARPRGVCLIINNQNFNTTELKPRTGSDIDERALEDVFKSFYFEVLVAKDLTAEEMEIKMREVSMMNHEKYNCFVCCILSHGEENQVFGVDGKKLHYSKLTVPFKPNACTGLLGKPKLFFIQACRGKNYQLGEEEYEMDGHSGLIPNEADFLMAHATVEGFVSIRSKHSGSWFIQSLCKVFKLNAKSLDLMDMILMVNNEVSSEDGKLSKMQVKQVPGPLVTLRKKVFFLEDSD